MDRIRVSSAAKLAAVLVSAALIVIAAGAARAQPPHPFAVGAGEGAIGHPGALGAWLLAQESRFYLALTGAVRAARSSAAGWLGLIGLSFAYGVFHAAGPGHGKAVITSYLVSNEVALRRGIVIAVLAALLQGAIATGLIGAAALLFHATAPRMTEAARAIEFFSYVAIVTLGAFLCWRKGWALVLAIWPALPLETAASVVPLAAGATLSARVSSGRFHADDGTGIHGVDCGCSHMPDPRRLAAARFNLRAAALAVVTAGARPCSGAILVLVFSLAQGMFAAGITATFAMALGTAVTTGGLAALAVFAKGTALRLAGRFSRGGLVLGRAAELAAAAAVLLFGIILMSAWLAGAQATA